MNNELFLICSLLCGYVAVACIYYLYLYDNACKRYEDSDATTNFDDWYETEQQCFKEVGDRWIAVFWICVIPYKVVLFLVNLGKKIIKRTHNIK